MPAPSNLPVVGTMTTTDDKVLCSTFNAGTAVITLTGTWTGTVTFEIDGGAGTWPACRAAPVPTGAIVTTATGNGTWVVGCAGFVAVRTRFSTASSGTVTATIGASIASTPTLGAAAGS